MRGPAIVPYVETFGYNLPSDTVPTPTQAGGLQVMFGPEPKPLVAGRGIMRGVYPSYPQILASDPGAFVLAGLDVGLIYPKSVVGGVGAFVLGGQSSNGIHGYRIDAIPDDVLLIGQDIAFLWGHILSGGVGVFSLIGGSATLSSPANKVAGDVGTFAIAGVVTRLLYGHPLPAGVGAFTISGQAASLHKIVVMPAAAGAFRLIAGLINGTTGGMGTGGSESDGTVVSSLPATLDPTLGPVNVGTPVGTRLITRTVGDSGTTDDGDYVVGTPGGLVMINIDLIQGATGSRHIISGWGITRLAVVTGLEPAVPNAQSTGQLLQAALDALIALVGDRGSPCPDVDVPTYLEQFVPEVIDMDKVHIRIIYKGFPAPQFEFTSSLCQVESNLDQNGDLITVQYTYPDGYLLDPRKAGQTIMQGGMISRPTPEPSFTIKFIIGAGTINGVAVNGTQMMSWYMLYEGGTNNAPYTIGFITGQVHQWLITSVRGNSKDGGFSYEASITFQFRQAGWDPLVTFINPDDGKPPPDLIPGVGFKLVRGPFETGFPSFSFAPN